MSPLMPASLVALYNGMMDRTVQPTGAVSFMSPGVYLVSCSKGVPQHPFGQQCTGRERHWKGAMICNCVCAIEA